MSSEQTRASALLAELERNLRRPVRLTWTRNRRRVLSGRPLADGTMSVRLHAALADLSARETVAVARFLEGDAGARPAVREIVKAREGQFETGAPRRARRLVPRGAHHDLAAVLADVRSGCFAGHPELADVRVTWSGRQGGARKRLRLGWWDVDARVVHVHRRLDSADVPRLFVASVVHHELCHAVLGPPPRIGGRRRWHGPEFRRLEATFPGHEEARRWEEVHLHDLLRG